jgi:hypothetical protein
VVRRGLLPEQFAKEIVSVLSDPTRDRFPLVIAFGARAGNSGVPEIGASAVFRCDGDGRLVGYRYPFHRVTLGMEPQRYADLGDPESLTAESLGNAVAEFLEWATVGGGCDRRKFRFGTVPTLPFVRPPVKLPAMAA